MYLYTDLDSNVIPFFSTWSQFIDEMKTLDYRTVTMLGNPLADAALSDNNQGGKIKHIH